jgi:hypothetical protein
VGIRLKDLAAAGVHYGNRAHFADGERQFHAIVSARSFDREQVFHAIMSVRFDRHGYWFRGLRRR